MINNIKKIASIANELDKSGNTRIASVLDNINKNILKVVTSQYVGIQGYWIRNRRCWDNCYRQKRAETDKPAQEVWTECYKEYIDSINNDKSGWEKYAGEDKNIKTASKDEKDKNIKIANIIKKKVAENMPIPVAIYDTYENIERNYKEACINSSKELIKIASKLNDKGNIEASKALTEVSDNILKEAQFWQGVGSMLKGKGFTQGKYLEKVRKMIQEWIQVFNGLQSSSASKSPNEIKKEISNEYNSFITDKDWLNIVNIASRSNQKELSQAVQNVSNVFKDWRNRASQVPNPTSAVFSSLSRALYNLYAKIPTDNQATPAKKSIDQKGLKSIIDNIMKNVIGNNSYKQNISSNVMQQLSLDNEVTQLMQRGDNNELTKKIQQYVSEAIQSKKDEPKDKKVKKVDEKAVLDKFNNVIKDRISAPGVTEQDKAFWNNLLKYVYDNKALDQKYNELLQNGTENELYNYLIQSANEYSKKNSPSYNSQNQSKGDATAKISDFMKNNGISEEQLQKYLSNVKQQNAANT